MSRPGLLEFDDFGYALPVTNPSYSKPPYYMRGYENLSVSVEVEYSSVAEFLPKPLAFAEDNPIVTFSVRRIPFSTFGAALEASISYNVLFRDELWKYYPCYYVGGDGLQNETGMLMGREYYGNAKKAAQIELFYDNNLMVGKVFRPSGVPLFTVTVSPQSHAEVSIESITNQMNLRLIPAIDPAEKFDICQLIGQKCVAHPVIGSDGLSETWEGPGSISLETLCANEPWSQHKIRKVVSASYGRWHNYVPAGFVLYDYLEH